MAIPSLEIIPATPDHLEAIWRIFQKVTDAGDAYVFEAGTTRDEFIAYWFAPSCHPHIALLDNEVLGSYIVKPNQPGRGSHIANASYMTASAARGQGIAGKMCQHSLQLAKSLGFRAMQFNIVVATNEVAVALWQKHGFRIVGTLPEAFRHASLGYVDAHVMFRELDDIG
ncbi:GNAT family N-acetyltransferase [Haloferula sp. BvORR071]|uniref:GNAT family N-acetyltransferase n=1 Tax=Haloferula sp. BvORR071 TaxID=1396141 RepID=UPI00069672B4|nr:GNAT family N-acetyltransferase [Haloferula sp. BvORR071]